MKRGVLGIFDFEREYAERLVEYFKNREEICFEICLFTKLESLREYLANKKLEVLLICEEALEELDTPQRIKSILVLSENDGLDEQTEYPVIFKFQSGERLVKDVFSLLEGMDHDCEGKVLNPGPIEFIGVVSPKGGSGKTTFSMALGEACGRSEEVLYLSFEQIGSSFGLIEDKRGLSDLIYYLKQRRNGLFMLIRSLGIKIGGVDCIPSVRHFSDLEVIEKDDIDFLMEELLRTEAYKKVIFDIGSLNAVTLHILERCNSVYVTHLENDLYMEKDRAFHNIFCFEEKEALFNRMKVVRLPKDTAISQGNYQIDNLLEGELGNFIFRLMEKDAG